jgi:hypothetical protein
MTPKIMGIAWYREDQWDRMVSLCDDNLSKSYASWKKSADGFLENRPTDGIRVIKVIVDVDELSAFCIANSLNVDSKARNNFVNHLLAEKIRSGDIVI